MAFTEDDIKRFKFEARGNYFGHHPKSDLEDVAFDAGFDAALQAVEPYVSTIMDENNKLRKLRKLESKAKKLQRKVAKLKAGLYIT